MSREELVEKVRESLKTVMDPEIGVNIVDAGFVREVRVDDDGKVTIKIMLTTPFCPLSQFIIVMAENAAKSVEGVKDAKVEIVGYGLPPELERMYKLRRS